MDYAILGNCAYQALSDGKGRIVWLCWPRFDSDFVFGELLDDKAGSFVIEPATEGWTSQSAYEPLTNVLSTTFTCADGQFEIVDFAPRFRQYDRMFKPTMLCRRIRPLSGSPRIRITCTPTADEGRRRLKPYMASNHLGWHLDDGPLLRLTTNASLTHVVQEDPFVLDRQVDLALTYGRPLEAPLAETVDRFLTRTRAYWTTWSKHASLPTSWQEEVLRSALVLKLHQYEDTGAITAAATTSLPEHPGFGRTWDYRYCWPRDAAFTLGALARLGHFEEMEGFARYLVGLATTGHDLQPVYGIGGERILDERILDHLDGYGGDGPVRVGNAAYKQIQHDIYGEMVAAVAPMLNDIRYQGEVATMRPMLQRLLDDIDRHLESPDVGLWEKRQAARVHTFSLLMHWVGAGAARGAATGSGHLGIAERAAGLQERAAALIEKAWRPESGWFADALDTDAPDASLMMLVNMGYLSPDDPRAHQHVDALAEALDAGGGLLHRYLHDDGLGETHAAFTVCGFWYAEALARLSRHDEAKEVFQRLLGHANGHGLMSEDIDPVSGEAWGNFPQTYSHVGIIRTAFQLCRTPFGGI